MHATATLGFQLPHFAQAMLMPCLDAGESWVLHMGCLTEFQWCWHAEMP